MKTRTTEHHALKLNERRLALHRQVATLHESELVDRDSEPNDTVDHAARLEAGVVVRALGDAERVELGEIDAALARIGSRRYGTCESCGAAIAEKRLEAIPEARSCVPCASQPMASA